MKGKYFKNQAFTLAELLIVVAIIAVLVAVAIPVFTKSLEKSREAADLADIRSAYSEVSVKMLEDGEAFEKTVVLKQEVDGWQTSNAESSLRTLGTVVGTPAAGGMAKVDYSVTTPEVMTITFSGGGDGNRWAGIFGAPSVSPDLYSSYPENVRDAMILADVLQYLYANPDLAGGTNYWGEPNLAVVPNGTFNGVTLYTLDIPITPSRRDLFINALNGAYSPDVANDFIDRVNQIGGGKIYIDSDNNVRGVFVNTSNNSADLYVPGPDGFVLDSDFPAQYPEHNGTIAFQNQVDYITQ